MIWIPIAVFALVLLWLSGGTSSCGPGKARKWRSREGSRCSNYATCGMRMFRNS